MHRPILEPERENIMSAIFNGLEQSVYSLNQVIINLQQMADTVDSNNLRYQAAELIEIRGLIESFVHGVKYGLGASDSLYTVRELAAFIQDMGPDETISLDMLKVLKNG